MTVNETNVVDYIIDYESGLLQPSQLLDLFSYLIKTKKAWSLQGHYGRTAQALIDDEFITETGEIINGS